MPLTAAHLSIKDTDTPDEPLVLESCHSVWIFDVDNGRFRRIVKGLPTPSPVTTDWRPYDHLVLDEDNDAFLVFLDDTGSRLLRARRHGANGCSMCADNPTTELSLGAISELLVPPSDKSQATAN